jgi:hypothetical protein
VTGTLAAARSPQPRRRVEGLSERAAPPAQPKAESSQSHSVLPSCSPARPPPSFLPSFHFFRHHQFALDTRRCPSRTTGRTLSEGHRHRHRHRHPSRLSNGSTLLIHSSLVVTQHPGDRSKRPKSASVGAVAIQDGLSDSKDDLLRIDKRLPHSSKIYTCNPKLITIVDCGLALRERGEHLPVDDSLGPNPSAWVSGRPLTFRVAKLSWNRADRWGQTTSQS